MMRKRESIIRYFLLLTGFLMLAAYTLPHHHHSNGTVCYKVLARHHSSPSDTDGGEKQCCGCAGHYLFIVNTQSDLSSDGHPHLFPLAVLYDYGQLPAPADGRTAWEQRRILYIESLHDTWFSAASGRRAPPTLPS